jgi:hypothetical protein
MTSTPNLAALQEAYDIISEARRKASVLCAQRPYSMLLHAGNYITQAADQILAETTFAPPERIDQ